MGRGDDARSWDGSSHWGPDIWELSVESGQRLVYATFTNCGYFADNNRQTFPDNHPTTRHPGWTGASERQSLGYRFFRDRNEGRGYGTDGVYRMEVIFPHSDASLRLNFASHCDDPKEDQSWGVDNVRVEAVAAATRLTEEQLEECWRVLAGEDPVAAWHATWRLVSSGDQAVSFLDSKIHVAGGEESDLLRALLADLNANEYQVREKATKQLREFGRSIEAILREELRETTSPETRQRIRAILKEFEADLATAAEIIRRQRAARVLEVINTKAAQQLAAGIRGEK